MAILSKNWTPSLSSATPIPKSEHITGVTQTTIPSQTTNVPTTNVPTTIPSIAQQVHSKLSAVAVAGRRVQLFELGNMEIVQSNSDRSTLLNVALNQMVGRNKLEKYIKSLPAGIGICMEGSGLSATVSLSSVGPLEEESAAKSSQKSSQAINISKPSLAFPKTTGTALCNSYESMKSLAFLMQPISNLHLRVGRNDEKVVEKYWPPLNQDWAQR